jgi:hypothetical protein
LRPIKTVATANHCDLSHPWESVAILVERDRLGAHVGLTNHFLNIFMIAT